MRTHLPFPAVAGSLVALSLLSPVSPAQAGAPGAKPSEAAAAMQLPADQQAYKAARAIPDAGQQENALRAFLHDFPTSKRADAARRALIGLLLKTSPKNITEVHGLAQTLIDHATPDQRGDQENSMAYEFAEAPPNGVDLKTAATWAEDAVAKNTFQAEAPRIRKNYADNAQPVPPDKKVYEYWGRGHAAILQTLAEVYFHQGVLSKASTAIDQAMPLDPFEGALYTTRGQIAHARHQDAEAVRNLELAAAYGGLTAPTQALLQQLYAAEHPDNPSGLESAIDQIYEAQPKPFTPAPHTGTPTGHTVLVELYSGSGCEPCVAADYGVDGVLQAYPRSEVVALAFDQHIPLPDPLANPDSLDRAHYSGIYATPSIMIDGRPIDPVGGSRAKAQANFDTVSKVIEEELKIHPGVSLHLTAKQGADHTIATSAAVDITDAFALHQVLASVVEPDKVNLAIAKNKGVVSTAPAPQPAHLVLNFALVQQTVRYSGENGVRFHHMVVRALAKPSSEAFPVALTGSSQAAFTFDPSAISKALATYLTGFEQHSDRFGTTTFLRKDTSLPMDQLAVAAWVEDPTSHHIVAASFVPLSAPAAPSPQTQRAAQ